MISRVLASTTVVALWVICLPAKGAEPGATRVAQADLGARMGPTRSPNVVIEEPRPPNAVIETEGRSGRDSCHSVTVTERQEGVKVTRTEQRCDR
jgi:hypothetical protein